MAGRRHSQQEIEKKLQDAAELLAQGKQIAFIAKQLGVSKQTLFRWRREYGSSDERLAAPRNRTRHAILDTAERLIAEEGLSVSLRRIMAEADVNIAAINYHFGSRESLIDALAQRRLGIVCDAQLQRLEAIERRGKGVRLEEIVHAFIGPPIEASLSLDPGWQHFSRFMVALAFEPAMNPQDFVESANAEVHPRFVKALQKHLPELPDSNLYWRFLAMISVMQSTLHSRDRLSMISSGRNGGENYAETLAQLTPIIVGIWTAPPARHDVEYKTLGFDAGEISEVVGS